MENTNIDDLTFQQAMEELDICVKKLESNSLELEQSLIEYERGVKLIASLQLRISNAQQKMEVLKGELAETLDDEVQDGQIS